jgi:type IV pilus assembly protein PilC
VDKAKLAIPLFKKMFRALYISRSLHTMGQLINAGVPMLDTIAITADISGNSMYKRMWRNVYSSVKQGKKITYTLQKSPLLPERSCR